MHHENMLPEILFIKKNVIFQENFICKEKSGSVTTLKLVTKIKKPDQLYFGTLVLALYCYCGDKAWKAISFR